MPKSACMSIFGHTFLAITQPPLSHFRANWGTQETIIYQLAMRNPSYEAYSIFDLLGHLWSGASKPDQKVGLLGGLKNGISTRLEKCINPPLIYILHVIILLHQEIKWYFTIEGVNIVGDIN